MNPAQRKKEGNDPVQEGALLFGHASPDAGSPGGADPVTVRLVNHHQAEEEVVGSGDEGLNFGHGYELY